MYKGKPCQVKSHQQIHEHIAWGRGMDPGARRIFLADGNCLALETELLLEILKELYEQFPHLERVALYGGPRDILAKSNEELKALQQAGLHLVYLGVESGSAQVLGMMKKGVTPEEMTKAGVRVQQASISLSCMLISGLGGRELWREHALESARVINAINPKYLALLTLMVEENTPLCKLVQAQEFQLLSPQAVLAETLLLLENLDLDTCTFRSNHPSNYLNLTGVLSRDKQMLIEQLRQARDFRSEGWRAL
jgi:radical SAM superfamily enzyme YgiQ (UPF0313 family)